MSRSFCRQVLAPLAVCAALTALAAVGMGDSLGAAGPSSTNPAFLPIGDGKVSTSGPQRGYVYRCGGGGAPPGDGGAFAEGPWIRGDGTYDLTAKAIVDGAVSWSGRLGIRLTNSRRIFSGNGLPARQTTGEFPIQASDDAYQYDRNPNSIRSQSVSYSLPRHPEKAARPSCLSGGAIGIAKNGVAIFDGLDALQRDAVAHEVQDACGGHPQQQGVYHYHSIPACLTAGEPTSRASGLVGFALDGFPIYGPAGPVAGCSPTETSTPATGRRAGSASKAACSGSTTTTPPSSTPTLSAAFAARPGRAPARSARIQVAMCSGRVNTGRYAKR